MVAFGVGEICGGPILGYVIDKKGNKAATFTNIIMITTQTVFVILFLYYDEYNWLAFAMTFLWGVQDSANNTHTSEMLGYEFEDSAQPYAIDNFVESIACFAFEIFESFVGNRRQYMIFNLVVGILGIFMNATTFLFKFKLTKEERKALRNEKNVSLLSVLGRSMIRKEGGVKKLAISDSPEEDE